MNEPTQAQKELLPTVAKIVYPHFMYFAGDDTGVVLQYDGLNKLDFDTWQELAEHLARQLERCSVFMQREIMRIANPDIEA